MTRPTVALQPLKPSPELSLKLSYLKFSFLYMVSGKEYRTSLDGRTFQKIQKRLYVEID